MPTPKPPPGRSPWPSARPSPGSGATCAPGPYLPEFLDGILRYVPEGEVADRHRAARDLPPETSVFQAARILGNGDGVSAQDTVPFVLWCAGQHLGSYEDALWLTVSGLGDRDTTCAMVGGIVALSAGAASIPDAWIAAREPLPAGRLRNGRRCE